MINRKTFRFRLLPKLYNMINRNTFRFRLLPKLNHFQPEQELPQHIPIMPNLKPTFQGP